MKYDLDNTEPIDLYDESQGFDFAIEVYSFDEATS